MGNQNYAILPGEDSGVFHPEAGSSGVVIARSAATRRSINRAMEAWTASLRSP
jgi:hypothetical protein